MVMFPCSSQERRAEHALEGRVSHLERRCGKIEILPPAKSTENAERTPPSSETARQVMSMPFVSTHTESNSSHFAPDDLVECAFRKAGEHTDG